MEHKNWNGFNAGSWQNEINVRDFIQQNYAEYKTTVPFYRVPPTEQRQ